MTKNIFYDNTDEANRKDRLRKPHKPKRKTNAVQSLRAELPPDFPKDWTLDEKVDFWRNLNHNLPRWMK